MPITHSHLKHLIDCINLEEKEQVARYSLDQQHTLKTLKAEGLAIHPISVTRKNFGYADYPEISFKINFPAETNFFKGGAAIEIFLHGETPVKGVLLNLEGKTGEARIIAPDFPDWIEDDGLGLKLAPDQHTTSIMKKALSDLETHATLFTLFRQFHGEQPFDEGNLVTEAQVAYYNKQLNESQQKAVDSIVNNKRIVIVHGPPGTGKTTTLIEAIRQLINNGEKILVSAPSNTAVDNIAKGLINAGANVLRVGNTSKVDELVFEHTTEGKLSGGRQQKEIKQLKIRAEEFRKMALKYKRSFGKAEKEQRNLLFQEVKSIRSEIKKLQNYYEEKLFTEADVILGTPVGLYDAHIRKYKFDSLIIDEAGQLTEPLAWCIFPLAKKYVLAGDHLQLPPTVLSNEAAAKGFNKSILEFGISTVPNVYLLDTQYRMRASIAGFSGSYFYDGKLLSAAHLNNTGVHLTFIDTAGSGYNEENGSNGTSLLNEGELTIALKLIETEALDINKTAFISPYAGQVSAAKEVFPQKLRISTIDSFQGQEMDIIILSLVRSNDEGIIGFLKDYRRMNVAMTRAKEQLYIIGDSATIGADPFYNAFLVYVENAGKYRSIWEFEL